MKGSSSVLITFAPNNRYTTEECEACQPRLYLFRLSYSVTNILGNVEIQMPAASTSKDEIIDRLFTVFRDRGFEGASLADLSRATGLGRSSLYHYFPEGKDQMAAAVLARAEVVIDSQIFRAAQAPEPLSVRVRKIVSALEHMYSGGRTLCVLGQLATASLGPSARESLRNSFEQWTVAIAKLARDGGMKDARARDFAEDWVARLQGTLILQAAHGRTGPFKRVLKTLHDLAKETRGSSV
jgi:TetR/AcrR family transcriptional repressor of lmrAB and yxaGH operons